MVLLSKGKGGFDCDDDVKAHSWFKGNTRGGMIKFTGREYRDLGVQERDASNYGGRADEVLADDLSDQKRNEMSSLEPTSSRIR